MNADGQDFKHTELTEKIIKAFYKATNIEVGLLLNFGPKPEVKRKAFDNI
ncbi:MAG: hypothetical protein V2A53_00740 [bacterium]